MAIPFRIRDSSVVRLRLVASVIWKCAVLGRDMGKVSGSSSGIVAGDCVLPCV